MFELQKVRSQAMSYLIVAVVASALMSEAMAQLMPERLSPPEQFSYWLGEAATAYNAGDTEAWVAATEKLHALRPFNQDFMTHLIQGYGQTNQTSKAFNMMLMMQQQGLAEDWSRFEELEGLREHNLYEHLANLMQKASEPFGQAQAHMVVPGRVSMPEAMAYDAATDRLFVGTVRDGAIYVQDNVQDNAQDAGGDAGWAVFADGESVPDLMAVFGLAIDAERNHLWVATGMASQYRHYSQSAFGRTALIKLNLETGEHIATHRVIPDGRPHLLGAITVASDGTVYATDSLMPLVYHLPPDADNPRVFFGSAALSSLRGLALNEELDKLYVADYELGLMVLDTSGGQQAWRLAIPDALNLGGIDGLYLSDNYLVAIQNGISPERVLRLELGSDGLGVIAVAPIVAALETFDGPTYGAMNGSELYFFANSHWQHVRSNGQPIKRPLPDVSILKTDITNTEIQVVGEEVMKRLQQGQ